MPDFILPQKWLDPKNKEHVMLVAKKFQELRYGPHPFREQPAIRKDGSVEFPLTNDFWLFSPEVHTGQPKQHWRLAARYDDTEKLMPIIKALQEWSPGKPEDLRG